MEKGLKVVKWITYAEAQDKLEMGLGGWGGSIEVGDRWNDYVAGFKEEAQPLVEELRRSIISNKIRCTGYEAQNGYAAVPMWSNGMVDLYSFRGWGDLMAAVWSTEENKDYGYMDFYM